MVPENDDFDDAFAALVVGPFSDLPEDGERFVVCDSLIRGVDRGPSEELSQVGIAYRNQVKISLGALVSMVERNLMSRHHSLTARPGSKKRLLGAKVLALAVACADSKDRIRSNLNILFDSIHDLALDLFSVIEVPLRSPQACEIDGYHFGSLNSKRLERVCEHAGSDYFSRYGHLLENRLSLHRTFKRVKAVEFKGCLLYRDGYSDTQEELFHRILDDYYAVVAEGHWEHFRHDLDRRQAVLTCAGVGNVSTKPFWQLHVLTHHVAIFSGDLPDRGWVVPNNVVPKLDFVLPNAIAKSRSSTIDLLQLHDWKECGLDESLQVFAEYVAIAEGHEQEDRIEEALLHMVFAFDLLLGGTANEALTSTLSQRIAALCHKPLRLDFHDVETFVRDTYNMRSGYAHRGERARLAEDTNQLSLIERYEKARQVGSILLLAGLWVRKQKWCENRENWLTRIDLLIAKRNAGQPFESDLDDLGTTRIQQDESTLTGFRIDWAKPDNGSR